MQTISFKIEDEFLKDIEIAMQKYRYSTLTEFVRASIRERLKELQKEEVLQNVNKLAGSFKNKREITEEELHKIGDKVFDKLEKKHKLN